MDLNLKSHCSRGRCHGPGIVAHLAGAGIPDLLLDVCPEVLTDRETAAGLTLASPLVKNRLAREGKERVVNPRNRVIYDPAMGDMITVGNFDDDVYRLNECD